MENPTMKRLIVRFLEIAGSQNAFDRLFTSAKPPHTPGSEGPLGLYAFLDFFAKPPIYTLPKGFQKTELTLGFVATQYVLSLVFVVLPPFPFREYIAISIQTAMMVQATQMYTDINLIFIPIMILIGWFNALDIFILHGVPEDHAEFREVGKKDKSPRTFTILEKFNWALGLSFQLRGVNWGNEVKNVRRWDVPKTKTQFLLNRAKYIAISFFMMDLANSLVTVFEFREDLSRFGRTFVGILFISSGGFVVQFVYCFSGFLMVATGLGRMEDWPPLYHLWSECYSLRRFWGKTYHQLFRRPLSEPAHIILQKIGVDRRSFLGRSFVRFFAFLVSGIGHGWNAAGTYGQDNGCTYIFMYFFVMLEIEDVLAGIYDELVGRTSAKAAGRDLPRTKPEKIFGYLWTIWWIIFMCRMVVESMGPTGSWMAAPTDNLLESVWIWALGNTGYLKPKYYARKTA